MKQRTDIKKHPICTKCGYDQSGEVSIWQSRCPLEGRCPECGHGFAWADVFDPSRTELVWYVEHAHSKWELIKRTPGTMRRLVLPWVYWRAVGVEAEIRLQRLLLWVVSFVVGLHLLVSVPVGFGYWFTQGRNSYGSLGGLYQRAGLEGLIVPVVDAVCTPFFSAGISYRSNRLIFFSGFITDSELRDATLIALPFIGMTLLWMVVLLVAPVTRRRAKIRSAHVIRALLISIITIAIAFELTRGAHMLDILTSKGRFAGKFWVRVLTESFIPLMMLWVLVFWGSAIRAGWKIRPSRLLITLGSITSLLGGFVFYFVTAVYLDWI